MYLSHVSCLMPPVSHFLSHIACLMSPVSCLTYPVSPVSCVIFDPSPSHLTSPVSRLLSHVPSIVPNYAKLFQTTRTSSNNLLSVSSNLGLLCFKSTLDLAVV